MTRIFHHRKNILIEKTVSNNLALPVSIECEIYDEFREIEADFVELGECTVTTVTGVEEASVMLTFFRKQRYKYLLLHIGV